MIRLAVTEDIPRLLQVYEAARNFMRSYGNDAQWTGAYPQMEILKEDIARKRLYVIANEGDIGGCFMLGAGPDPTYGEIYDGAWGSEESYGVIHRIAGDGSIQGVLKQAVEFAESLYAYLRIDTHEKNLPMRRALEKQGFTYRGIIYIADGTPRMAFDRKP